MVTSFRPAHRAAAGAVAAALLLGLAGTSVAVADRPRQPAASQAATGQASVARVPAAATKPRVEVWQEAEAAYPANPDNPLANRVWGVYTGVHDQVSVAYARAKKKQQRKLDTIWRRPRTQWYGANFADNRIRLAITNHIADSQAGDPEKLVQIAVFRMQPWEHEACQRAATKRERTSYRRWITQLAKGIGDTPALIVMQPDGPFLFCSPNRKQTAAQLRWATETLAALPRTAVYIDAGAADWCENDKGANPERCAGILKLTGIKAARGFALDSTHYTGPADNIRHGKRIVDILKRDGYGTKHFIIDTAKSGRPTHWLDMIPSTKGGLRDNARVCRTASQTRCVTLGIPPTVQVAAARHGLSKADRAIAERYVDGFVWFGRPWLHNQAHPFVMKRALTMAKSTPYAGPKL